MVKKMMIVLCLTLGLIGCSGRQSKGVTVCEPIYVIVAPDIASLRQWPVPVRSDNTLKALADAYVLRGTALRQCNATIRSVEDLVLSADGLKEALK